MNTTREIANRADIELLVDTFYAKVEKSPKIGHLFEGIDWSHHKPIMYNFWSTMILGDQTYRANPFEKHLRLSLGGHHFAEWLKLFEGTVDELFQGARANEIKERARSIAAVWKYKLGLPS